MTNPTSSASTRTPSLSLAKRLSTFFFRHPRQTLFLLLLPPLLWLGVFYLGSLGALLAQSFNYVDDFSGVVVRDFSLKTYSILLQINPPTNLQIIGRSAAMAFAVTLGSILIGYPLAYYMARFAKGRLRGILYLLVLLPLWSNYIVRVYAWKLILAKEGVANWFFEALGLSFVRDFLLGLPIIGGRSLSYSYLGMFLVFVYIWLPYMILPIYSALERVQRNLIDASSDLGARPGYTFRKIIFPLAFPGVVAGSIFTFSLTLGDFIIPAQIGQSYPFIGNTVLSYQGTTGNFPLAAAFTMVPIVIMGIYLLVARRLGAFDAI